MKTFSSFVALEQAVLHRNAALNPVLWEGDRLKPDVRTALLNFAEAWRKFTHVPEDAVRDELMVGGNASYFYNEASDIDVHLLVDVQSLGFGTMVSEFLKDRKDIWLGRYDVRVKGYPVEPYVQDVSEPLVQGQGVYSLRTDQWIQHPMVTDYDPENDRHLARKTADWRRAIDRLIDSGAGADEFDVMKRKLSDMRGRGIRRGGELSPDNLLFKEMRLSGHLEKMADHVRHLTSKNLSLE